MYSLLVDENAQGLGSRKDAREDLDKRLAGDVPSAAPAPPAGAHPLSPEEQARMIAEAEQLTASVGTQAVLTP